MIDDNPVERASIAVEMPGVRVLGSHVYYLKRILLWSAETQHSSITPESGRRTELIQAQLQRDLDRKRLSHQEFLQSLRLRVTLSVLQTTEDLQMNRAIELFNKTNQFNTTGERYTLEECHQHLMAGRRLYVFHAEDRFTQYGLIGAAWLNQNCIDHVVISCRALGLGIEDTLVACIADRLAQEGMTTMLGQLRLTEANVACRLLYSRNGFTQLDNKPALWSRPLAIPIVIPPHVSVTEFPR